MTSTPRVAIQGHVNYSKAILSNGASDPGPD